MAEVTFASKLNADGSFTIPREAVETLGLHPGDEIRVRIETTKDLSIVEHLDQAELQRKAALRFEEADRLVREPAKPLTDPYEAAWAEGVEEKARRIGLKL
ncbi:MAG TPA: AbrB/MazE/SpoVT family DNA-binding domain-containing protein [Chthonomonadaceae bacterium]|nr:AbrB/MazE/SpoVT family DNA-binding domain-containing protein [Chthonomonadaceae bacterium]